MTPEERERMRCDPANWRVGFLYYNPDDPRVLVPKRTWKYGGWTLNGAHPGRALLTLAAFLIIGVGPFYLKLAMGYRSPLSTVVVLGASIFVIVLLARRMAS